MMETENLVKEPSSVYTVRFQDCDPMGHLNNARFIDYILNAREDHLIGHYNISLREYMQKGFGWMVADHAIYYRKPAMYNEKVLIRTSLIEYGESELLMEAIVMDEGGTHVKALQWTRFVFVNVRAGKREIHSEELLSFFASILVEGISTMGAKERLQQLTELVKNK
jgi:YbgC/YbaW family acyl-CoA thioester hydrolase